MKLSEHSVIASQKITEYLLKWHPENDKSEFLKHAGYSIENWERLAEDIRSQLRFEAELTRKTSYGNLYRIRGKILTPIGILLRVVTIWMTEYNTGQTKFITLYPDKET